MSESNDDIGDILDRLSTPKSEYFEASKDVQRDSIERLWSMVCRFSELPAANTDERLRWMQVRFKSAVVARTFGMMDGYTFDTEISRYTQLLAEAMGGQAFCA